jgi:hypothetical protein
MSVPTDEQSYVPPVVSSMQTPAKKKKKRSRDAPKNQGSLLTEAPTNGTQYDAFTDEKYQDHDVESQTSQPAVGIDPQSMSEYALDIAHEAELTELQQRSVATFTRKLRYASYALMIPVMLVLFTPLWWMSLLFLTAIPCLIVYAYSHPTNIPKAVKYYLMALAVHELLQFAFIIVYFVHVKAWSAYDAIAVTGAFVDLFILTPLTIYAGYWLYKSLTLTAITF